MKNTREPRPLIYGRRFAATLCRRVSSPRTIEGNGCDKKGARLKFANRVATVRRDFKRDVYKRTVITPVLFALEHYKPRGSVVTRSFPEPSIRGCSTRASGFPIAPKRQMRGSTGQRVSGITINAGKRQKRELRNNRIVPAVNWTQRDFHFNRGTFAWIGGHRRVVSRLVTPKTESRHPKRIHRAPAAVEIISLQDNPTGKFRCGEISSIG